MSETVGEAVVRIRSDESGFNPGDAGKKAGTGYSKGFSGAIKGLAVSIAGVVAVGKTVSFFKDGVESAREYDKAVAKTNQIIEATGGAAQVTADHVSDLAASLEAKTAIDDAQIQSGANLILTFKNVRNEAGKSNDVFDRATKAALDLSSAGFGSVESASLQLGKALNDPVKGMSALSRSGVTFTDGQKAQIKAMTEAGDALGAQKIILAEVEAQVGGVAEASVNAGDRAAVAFDNIRQTAGALLVPALDALANVFADTVAPAIFSALEAAEGLGPVFRTVGTAISGLFKAGEGGGGFLDGIKAAAADLLPVVRSIVAQVGPALAGIGASLVKNVLPVLRDMAKVFVSQVLPAVTSLATYVSTSLVPVFTQVFDVIADQVIPTLASLASFFYTQVYPAIIQIVTVVAQNLKPVFDQLVATFTTQVLPTIQRMIEQIRTQLIPALQPLITTVIQVVGVLYKVASAILGVVLPPLIRLVGWILSKVVPAVITIITWVAKFIGGLINTGKAIGSAIGWFARIHTTMVSFAANAVGAVVSAVASLPGKLLALGGKLFNAGKSIIGQFVKGLAGAGGLVSDIAGNVWNALRGLLNNAITKINRALEFNVSVLGKSIGINPPDIPHLQSGSRGVDGGFYDVGEVGPERVYLPPGARVLSAAQTRQVDAGSGNAEALARALAEALAPLLAGLRPVQFALPSGDPEAAAMATLNRLATVE